MRDYALVIFGNILFIKKDFTFICTVREFPLKYFGKLLAKNFIARDISKSLYFLYRFYLRGLHFFDIQNLPFGNQHHVPGADLVPRDDREDVLFFEKYQIFMQRKIADQKLTLLHKFNNNSYK